MRFGYLRHFGQSRPDRKLIHVDEKPAYRKVASEA
jgi:hypothetical protein